MRTMEWLPILLRYSSLKNPRARAYVITRALASHPDRPSTSFSMHRPGYGIASIKASNEQLSSIQQKGNKLAYQEIVSLSEQLSSLRVKLEAFTGSSALMSQIQANPEAAVKFSAICNRLGISTTQKAHESSINELAVQVCEVFIKARQGGGGLVSKSCLRSKVNASNDEHLNRALASLKPLGVNCKFHDAGEDVLIQFQDVSGFGGDSIELMNQLRTASTGLCKEQLMKRLAWKSERLEHALVSEFSYLFYF
jgi:hypothetical protein